MIDVIMRIFTEKEYQVDKIRVQDENFETFGECSNCSESIVGLFVQYKDKSIYYIFDFNEEINISTIKDMIIKKQEKYYNYMMSMNESNIIKQNCSLISCIKVKSKKDEQLLKDIVLEFEEDRFYFKKYIVVFTENEIIDFNNKIGNNNVNNFISRKLESAELFSQFKKGNIDNYYSLLLKILIKIPALTYGFKENRLLSNLQTEIDQILQQKKYFDLKVTSIKVGKGNDEINNFIDKLLKEKVVLNNNEIF